jgi:flotillin
MWPLIFFASLTGTVIFGIGVLKYFLHIGRPNEVLVFSGGTNQITDGRTVGYRTLIGGARAICIPILERVEKMKLNTLPIDIRVSNAYSAGGIPLDVHAVANIKISSNQSLIGNAIERFLGQDPREIQRVGKETLEGHLRGVLATLTPEEVNEDRLKFAKKLEEEADPDFDKLGLHLDTLKIQNVTDSTNYLESIGRTRIAEVIRDAEIAESNAMAEAKKREAHAKREAEVASENAQTSIVQAENALRQLQAELQADIQSAEEEAAAQAQQARAEAESELQEIRRELENIRLKADKVLPAQANKEASELKAQGLACFIEEEGLAKAAVLEMMTQAWLRAGKDAKDIFLIQQLEEVLETVVQRVTGTNVEEVVLLDNGDGTALPTYIASYPASIRRVLEELHASTGVDVTGILAGAIKK